MIREISQLMQIVFSPLGMIVSNIHQDLECEEYLGYNFSIDKLKIKFRKSKVTPKKAGQFVTLWRRNTEGITEPFTESDDFNFYLIVAEYKQEFGFFMFPKNILIQKNILSRPEKDGKRGFRVYPDWDKPMNKQAEATKNWQSAYFINSGNVDIGNFEKIIYTRFDS